MATDGKYWYRYCLKYSPKYYPKLKWHQKDEIWSSREQFFLKYKSSTLATIKKKMRAPKESPRQNAEKNEQGTK